ncbi:N-acetylmuramic acid 6-phosphate etherase [Ruania halotolerans]|uniref:N-acetylmuramic acid 6-phosphate etherase n=1 Tax=Ruania halotolerans TaxID=2897773 RepID=UPI001E28EA42|nr:N-acetylmuramic acid 6-phosphate etherase [Ruania halotolerans]UFU05313.1 N-acetylmuramic acid 6-phosphate etherase [Ruania halotolerans]
MTTDANDAALLQVKSPTEERNPRTAEIDIQDAAGIVRLIADEDARVAGAVAAVGDRIAALVELGVAALASGGRILYVGSGTSGRLAVLDAVELLPTYRVGDDQVTAFLAGGAEAMTRPVEGAEDDPAAGAADVAGARDSDLVIGLAASGRTPYVRGALEAAVKQGASTGLIACNPHAELADLVDVAVLVDTGPEVVTGSTRMKAGTAQKLVLNTFSTATMVRLGKTYSNLMIDVLPTNQKLHGRIVRMLVQATGRSQQECRTVLAEAGDPRTALVCLIAAVGADEARAALAQNPPDPARSHDPAGVRSAVAALGG